MENTKGCKVTRLNPNGSVKEVVVYGKSKLEHARFEVDAIRHSIEFKEGRTSFRHGSPLAYY